MHPSDAPFPRRSPGVPRFHLQLLGGVELTDGAGRSASAALSQPKRVALLAYLATARPRGFHRRDALLALLWPELDTERARAALRKGVHWLRAELGEGAIVGRGNEEVALSADWVGSDVGSFEAALDAGRPEEAIAAYRGDLLAGFHVTGAAEFDRWLEGERTRLRGRAAAAAWATVEARLAEGDQLEAMQRGRRAVALSPGDEGAVRRLIALLDGMGNRAGALHAYDSFARQLADDFAARPSAETEQLMQAVRSRVARISGPLPEPQIEDSGRRRLGGPRSRARAEPPSRRVAAIVGLVTLLAVVGAGYLWSRPRTWVTTSSREAYAEYQRGLAATGRGNFVEGLHAFEQALADDSSFAMAAFEAAVAAGQLGQDSIFDGYYERSDRLADLVSERERLLIRATWADRMAEPAVLSLAESLATRYPDEPAGANLLGRALMNHGDFLGAVQEFRRVAGRDSAELRPDSTGPCTECDALEAMVWSYHMADSLAASERTAREWVRRQPGSAVAWQALSAALESLGHYDESAAANRMTMGLRAGGVPELMRPADLAMVQGRFEEADRLLAEREADGSEELRHEALWFRIISLRSQGRLDQALLEARRYRRMLTPGSGAIRAGLPEAIVLSEAGQSRQAAALFDSIAKVTSVPWSESRAGRAVAWNLTHAITALAQLGDTLAMLPIIDSVERAGRMSTFGRDPLLHHYGRGLLLLARGDTAAAVEAFRRGIFSLTGGFSRLNLVLARSLLTLGRAREAIPLLEAPIHSALEAGNLYATQTELHEALGRAFEAAGEPDSARAEFRWVLGAWEHADPAFAWRRREVGSRMARLSAPPAMEQRR